MLDLLLAGGWLMVPLLLCSILALAIIIERSWALRYNNVAPEGLINTILYDLKHKNLNREKIKSIEGHSPLGELLIVAVDNIRHDRDYILSEIEDNGRKIMHRLERHLNMLGIIATITPLLGLLGTVIGMINVFAIITEQGLGNANTLAGGISQALITTAVGLSIAIPSLVFYKFFERRLDEIAYRIQHEAVKMVDLVKSQIKQQ